MKALVYKLAQSMLLNQSTTKRRILLFGALIWTSGQTNTIPVSAANNADAAAKTKSTASSIGDDALLARARRNKQMFEDEEAINDFTAYLTAHPGAENVRAERAEEYRNEHRFEELTGDLQILMKSKNLGIASRAASDLGKMYQKTGKYQEAIKTFKFARSLGVTTLLTELSDCARLSGDNETALQVSNEIIKSGRMFEGKQHRAKAYLAINKPKLALDDLNFLVDFERKYIASIDKESREIYPATKRLLEALEDRAKCFDTLKETKLAQQDKASMRKLQQEFFNESPFLIKDKH